MQLMQKYPKQTSWQIIYTQYTGMEKAAVQHINREAGKYLIREEGVYTLYVLPCREETAGMRIEKNAFVIGAFSDSALIRRFITEEEVEKADYLVRTVSNPDDPDGRLILITAKDPNNLYYAAVCCTDDFQAEAAPDHHGFDVPQWVYDYPLPSLTLAGRMKAETRGLWSWGHVINDYRFFLRRAAELRLNEVVLWNDHMPLNAPEIIACAHEYGIRVIWGYAWGWNDEDILKGVSGNDAEAWLNKTKQTVLEEYEQSYGRLDCDGIYFQSFTETAQQSVNGRSIAAIVTEFVNDVAGELLQRHPGLRLQFGLHAMSVKNHLDEIAKIDPRIEILWEDCGAFPFGMRPESDETAFLETLDFTRRILSLRPGSPVGLVLKGMIKVDWTMFCHQAGPYLLGENASSVIEHDRRMKEPVWQGIDAQWMAYGSRAQQLIREIFKLTDGKIGLYFVSEDGLNSGGHLSEALCAQLFCDPDQDFSTLLRQVARRQSTVL